MKIAVIGAGAIGGLVAGYLKLSGADVILIARENNASVINDCGLLVKGIRGDFQINISAYPHLASSVDLIILATKTQDIASALSANLKFLKDTVLITTQNGVAAEEICARFISPEYIISSIVMFGATSLKSGEVIHNFEGSWIMDADNKYISRIKPVLSQAFRLEFSSQIKAMKYLKIFVNANNCIPAILGQSMQEVFSDIEIAKISIAIWKEGLEIVNRAGIKLESLPDFPLERLIKLTSLPTAEAAKIFSAIMTNLSKEPLYGSILQSIKKGRASEIDYLNGEFVRIAQEKGLAAPLNKRLVEMVHQVEKNNRFFSKEELKAAVKGWVN